MIAAILAFAASVAFASAEAAAPPKTSSGPVLVAAEVSHDFGKASVGDRLTYTFALRNEGTETLQLLEALADCACVSASFDKAIAPGASGELRVVFDTTDRVGPLMEKVVLRTNDPVAPKTIFALVAKVPPVLDLRPGYARYIYVQGEVPGVIRQTVWAVDGKDFEILSVKSPYPYLAATFREAKPEERRPEGTGKQWRVETVLSPDAPVGALAAVVEIVTSHPRQKTVRFEVSGFVRPVIAVTPANATLGSVKLEKPKIGSFRVQVFSTEEVEVTGVDTDVKGLKLDLEPVRAGRNYSIHLALTPDLPKGEFRGTIRIHTASAKAPLLEVPVSGTLE
jgi:hypothetical protein